MLLVDDDEVGLVIATALPETPCDEAKLPEHVIVSSIEAVTAPPMTMVSRS